MKKLTLFLVSALFVSGTFAQLRVDSSGRIDISSPFAISSPISTPTSHTPVTFRVGNTNAGFTGSSNNFNVSFGFGTNSFNSGSGNTAVGTSTLSWNTTGRNNTAFGAWALGENITGSENTAIGIAALFSNGDGWGNTAIGYAAGADMQNMRNTIVIGYWTHATSNNEVRIGNDDAEYIGGIVDWHTHSDGRTKKNISANVPGLDFINRLQPVTYNLDLNAVSNLRGANRIQRGGSESFMQQSLSQEQLNIIEQGRVARQRQVQTGFVAQDVAEVARNIGYEFSGVVVDDIGVYGLRYGQFVVPLVRAVQELSEQNEALNNVITLQQRQIEHLQRQIDEIRNPGIIRPFTKNASDNTYFNTIQNETREAVLHQNVPNPFNQSTQIRYYLPETVRNASLIIFDMQGKQLMQIPLTQRGEGVEIIQGSQLSPGIYLYALIADGREVDVKRMILTK